MTTIRTARVRRALALVLCFPAPSYQAFLEDIPSWHAPYFPFYAALLSALAYQIFRIATPWSAKPQRFVVFNERPFLEWTLLVGGVVCAYGGFSMLSFDQLMSLERGNEIGFAILGGPYSLTPNILTALALAIAGVFFLVVRAGTIFDGVAKTIWSRGLFPRRVPYGSVQGLGVFETRWMRSTGYSHSTFEVALFVEGVNPKPVPGLFPLRTAAEASAKIAEIHAQSGVPMALRDGATLLLSVEGRAKT